MYWTLNVMYLVFSMTVCGSCVTAVWGILGKLLERSGFLHISCRLWQAGLIFWLCPLSWLWLNHLDIYGGTWGGDLLLGSPALHQAAEIWFAVWVTGMGVCMVLYFRSLYRVAEIRRSAIPCSRETQRVFEETLRRLSLGKMGKRIRAGQSYRVMVPQVTGCLAPMILLPVREYTEEELQVVFTHELTHVRHRDILMKNLALCVRAIHFMNPVAWWIVKGMNRWSEYACDHEACREKGARQYYTVILDMVEQYSLIREPVSRLVENESDFRNRMRHVLKCYKKKQKSKALAALLLAGIVGCSGSILPATSVRAAEVLQKINEETAEEICEKHCANDPAEEEYTEAETRPDVRVYDGEVEENARASSATFNWTVYPNSLTRTAKTIRAEAGEWISVSVRNPSGRTIRAGIIHPNGSKRYVSGTTKVSHTFTISETGYYRVYVENPGDTTISVSGVYDVY